MIDVVRVPDDKALGVPSFDRGADRFLALVDGQLAGRVAVTYLDVGDVVEALCHDLLVEDWAPSGVAVKLVQAARGAVRARAIPSMVFTVETSNERMMAKCVKAGMTAEAVSFRCPV